jgi:tetratricopeptide (TPR) repeat protein
VISPSSRRTPWLAALGLVVLIVGAYMPSLGGGFLWDDDLHITANPTIVGPLGLKEIWTTSRANYFPLVLTNFWAQHALWGLEPFGYRVVTLGFHALSALLLWQVLRRLAIPGAWIGAAWWALHPVQVESVAWICELKNTQSAAFFLLAILAYVRWLDPGKRERGTSSGSEAAAAFGNRRWYLLALLWAMLAILSKPSTVMLPIALGLCSWWVRRRIEWRDAWRLGPFFALSVLAAGWTIWEQKFNSGAIGPEWSQSFPERIAIAGRVAWFYLGKLAWPEPLMFIYPRWEIDPRQWLSYLPAALAVGGFVWLLFRSGRSGRLGAPLFATAFFLALLFPVLGFFNVYFFRYSFVGDHFQYLASMGPLALAGAALATLAGRRAALIGAAVALALGLYSARQSRVYLSHETLWRDTLAHNPTAVMAWLNLADSYAQAGRYDEAIATFRRALELRPTDADGWNDLGNVLALVGRAEEALAHFERALELKPDFAEAYSNYGHALQSVGRSDDALRQYRRALELKPNHPGALNNLGAELAQRGEAAEAREVLERAVRVRPGDAASHDNLASVLRQLGRWDEALASHREAIRLQPDFAAAHANLGRTLVQAGRPGEALPHFERALQLKPALASASGHYAAALAAVGRVDEALSQLERAVAMSPSSAEAQLNLGVALAQAGRTEEAVERFAAALRLAPNFAPAHANLGNAFLALRRWAEAVPHLEAVVRLQPESAAAHLQLAVARVNNQELAAAVPHFETALRLNPRAADVRENFSQVLNALGRRREAFEQMEEAARLRRDGAR